VKSWKGDRVCGREEGCEMGDRERGERDWRDMLVEKLRWLKGEMI
jgi:hypothetical protein